MNFTSIKCKGHICFRDEYAGFDADKPITIIVGPNNSGKSRLIDFLRDVCVYPLAHFKTVDIQAQGKFSAELLKTVFSEKGLLSSDWAPYFIDIPFSVEIVKGDMGLAEFVFPSEISSYSDENRLLIQGRISQNMRIKSEHIFFGSHFRRIDAERDVRIELASNNMDIDNVGNNATNVIRRLLLSTDPVLPKNMVKEVLLPRLNQIVGPGIHFSDIEARIHDSEESGTKDHWEIFLAERNKGRVPLSLSGSGLKTILLVLLNLLVVPRLEKHQGARLVYAFEELENNLHPETFRKLLLFLEKHALEHKSSIFLTTHSSIPLDVFGKSEYAQIIRVEHDGKSAKTTTIKRFSDMHDTLLELGNKPSDLLFANGIIWVEGPSDRIYLKKWIELLGGDDLQEGVHFQFAYTAGTLLSHLNFLLDDSSEKVNLANMNRNVYFVCDRDQEDIKGRVAEIRDQVQTVHTAGIWILSAKEIENYLPGPVLSKTGLFRGNVLPNPLDKEIFFTSTKTKECYWRSHAKNTTFDKMQLAMAATKHMTRGDVEDRFDLKENVERIIKKIREWNSFE